MRRIGKGADQLDAMCDRIAEQLRDRIDELLGDDARAVEILGGIVNQAVVNRLELAEEYGDVVLQSRAIKHPAYDDAVVRTPLLVAIGLP